MCELGDRVVGFTAGETLSALTTEHGEYEADVVIVSIGVTPNTAFAEGLEKLPKRRIAADPAMKTSEPDVFAAGDCAGVWHSCCKNRCICRSAPTPTSKGASRGTASAENPFPTIARAWLRHAALSGLEFAKTG